MRVEYLLYMWVYVYTYWSSKAILYRNKPLGRNNYSIKQLINVAQVALIVT